MTIPFSSDDGKVGTFYFSHSEAVLPLLALIGLYEDGDLKPTAGNYEEEMGRKYRTSKIVSMSANLAFVAFDCQGEERKVLTLHQEEPVVPRVCDGELCDWAQFQEAYREAIDCPFEEMCALPKGKLSAKQGEVQRDVAAEMSAGVLTAISSVVFTLKV